MQEEGTGSGKADGPFQTSFSENKSLLRWNLRNLSSDLISESYSINLLCYHALLLALSMFSPRLFNWFSQCFGGFLASVNRKQIKMPPCQFHHRCGPGRSASPTATARDCHQIVGKEERGTIVITQRRRRRRRRSGNCKTWVLEGNGTLQQMVKLLTPMTEGPQRGQGSRAEML